MARRWTKSANHRITKNVWVLRVPTCPLSRNGMNMPNILAVLWNLDELSMTKAQTLPTPYMARGREGLHDKLDVNKKKTRRRYIGARKTRWHFKLGRACVMCWSAVFRTAPHNGVHIYDPILKVLDKYNIYTMDFNYILVLYSYLRTGTVLYIYLLIASPSILIVSRFRLWLDRILY